MTNTNIIEFISIIHNIDVKKLKKTEQKGFTRYQILNLCGMDTNRWNYKKINECIDMGFLKRVKDNPPEFLPEKGNIWDFWKKTPQGRESKKMIAEHVAVFE